jgi:SAM-dependent methyltransferase
MIKYHNPAYNAGYLLYRWVKPLIDPIRAARSVPGYVRYMRDWLRYGRLEGAEPRAIIDTAPQLGDDTSLTPFDRHYFYQDIWAFRKIKESGVEAHVDVGSRIDLIGFLSVICRVRFVDIRPLVVDLPNFQCVSGSILDLPMENDSIPSLSCLHVAEHIGLGRYGDPLDPHGTRNACRELARVLAPGGNLYFSLPVGKPRLCFNAHRIHAVEQILEYFRGLNLVEFSGIGDDRRFVTNIAPDTFQNADYACGLFHFTKK